MLSEKQIEFTKENIDMYLKEVAKEYRKQIGKNMPAEMVLIGGASVLVNYGFRDMTAVPEKKEKPAKKTQPAKSKITYDELYNADIKTTEGQELAEALLESLERSEYTLGTVANNGYTFNIAMEGKKALGYIQDESGHVVFSTKQRNDQTHLSKNAYTRVKKNILTIDEAEALGLSTDKSINYHGLGEALFKNVINDLESVKLSMFSLLASTLRP